MPETLTNAWLVVGLFAVAAALYASVGHGGASAYLALMVWVNWPLEAIRPQALVLNCFVSLVGTVLFFRAGVFRRELFVPLILASMPLAWLGGRLTLPAAWYEWLLAAGLLFAAVRLVLPSPNRDLREPPVASLLLIGGVIGFVSGLIGIGGGIFLTPVLILAGWAAPKEAAALSAPFIFLNSAAGLLGLVQGGTRLDNLAWVLVPAVLVGGFLGARWGSRHARPLQLRYALAVVLLLASCKLLI